jgi:hypothetical protein
MACALSSTACQNFVIRITGFGAVRDCIREWAVGPVPMTALAVAVDWVIGPDGNNLTLNLD